MISQSVFSCFKQSRMLIMTLDENLKPLSVAAVSVGEAAAVDVIYWWEAEAE